MENENANFINDLSFIHYVLYLYVLCIIHTALLHSETIEMCF